MAAYNNYFPATYPYNQAYYQNAYNQMQAQQTTQMNQINQSMGIIWVNGDAEADSYPIAPNNAVTLWHRTAPVVYFKQADASGRPNMKIYNLVERAEAPVIESEASGNKNIHYATKNDLEALQEVIDDIDEKVEVLKKEIDKKKKKVERGETDE